MFQRTYNIMMNGRTFNSVLDHRAINAFEQKHGSILRLTAELGTLFNQANAGEEVPITKLMAAFKTSELTDLVAETIQSAEQEGPKPTRIEIEDLVIRGNVVVAVGLAIQLLTSFLATDEDAPSEVDSVPLGVTKRVKSKTSAITRSKSRTE